MPHLIKNKLQKIMSLSAFREMGLYTVSNFLQYLSSFVSMFFVSRYLGPVNLGLYSFVQNYAALYITVIGGADYYFSWSLARAEDKLGAVREYVINKIYLSIFLTLLAISLGYFVLPRDVFVLVYIFMAPLFLHSLSAFHLYSLYEKRAKLVASCQMLASLFAMCSKLALIYFQAPLKYFVLSAGLDIFLLALIFFAYYMKSKYYRNIFLKSNFLYDLFISNTKDRKSFLYYVSIFFKNSFLNLKSGAIKSFLFFWSIRTSLLAVFLWQLLLRADQLILATFSNAYTLGIYSAAVKVAEVPNVIAGIIYVTLIGRMTHMLDSKTEESKKKLKRIFYMYIFLGSLASLFIYIIAPTATHIIYGEKFAGVSEILRMYCISIPAMYALYYYFSIYGAENRHKLQIIVFAISLLINVFLVLTLTPIYGLVGTASATVISYTFAALIFYRYSR